MTILRNISIMVMRYNEMTIQELRKSMGLSQSKFAKYYGLNIRTLQDCGRGRCNPPSYLVDLLVRLNKAEGLRERRKK